MTAVIGSVVTYWGTIYPLHGTEWTVIRVCGCESCTPDSVILPPEVRYVLMGGHGTLEHVSSESIVEESK